ncbi:hypothetical protein NSZ01_36240 [Nocardioides szechwanensis]|nr:hypothetical protein NSZ01_36240 [Nocardioides szechwanensis]
MLDLQAQRPGQVDALGTAVEHRLGPDVDEDPADLVPAQLATDVVRLLEDHDLVPCGDQVAGCGEAGDAGPDNDARAHVLSMPVRPRTAEAGCTVAVVRVFGAGNRGGARHVVLP